MCALSHLSDCGEGPRKGAAEREPDIFGSADDAEAINPVMWLITEVSQTHRMVITPCPDLVLGVVPWPPTPAADLVVSFI